MIPRVRYRRLALGGLLLLALQIVALDPTLAGDPIGAWIDPGHGIGCGDVGAPGFNGETPPDERHLSLLVSQRVSTRLGALGYISYLTRNSDHCVQLRDRVRMSTGEIENDVGEQEAGVVFVSVHMDGDGCSDFTLTGTFTGSTTSVPPRERGGGLTFLAWPNPSRGVTVRFVGRFEEGSARSGTLRIVDTSGRSVYIGTVYPSGDQFDVQWDCRGNSGNRVPPGRYVARVEIEGKSATTAFVIAR
jgi:hypothetical protein